MWNSQNTYFLYEAKVVGTLVYMWFVMCFKDKKQTHDELSVILGWFWF